jgi:hypothetical protein
MYLPASRVKTSQILAAQAPDSDPWPTPNSRLKLIDYLDHLAETAGDPKIRPIVVRVCENL